MSVFVKPLMDWFMFGMVIWSKLVQNFIWYHSQPRKSQTQNFYINVLWWMFYNFIFFAKPSMDFIQLWRDNRALSKILCCTNPVSVHDIKVKITDFECFCIKSLQCQLLQSLWLIWIMFAMTGYKILKCFRKEKRISGGLPLAPGLIFVLTCRIWQRGRLFHKPKAVKGFDISVL